MYQILYLETAKKDIDDIVYYITHDLKNYTAARDFVQKLLKEVNNIKEFPYSNAVYESFKTLENQYRKCQVKNYLIFYLVDEQEKIVIISRVIYQKRDMNNIL